MGFVKVFNTLLQSVIIQKQSSNLPHFPNISEHVIFLMKQFVGVKLICIHLRCVQDHNKDFSEVLEWISENGREEPEAKSWNAQCKYSCR